MLNRKNLPLIILYTSILLLYALLAKLWLISAAMKGSILCVQGIKPVAKPAFYSVSNIKDAWSSLLSIPMPATPPYVLIALLYALPSNLAWVAYEVLIPFLGGLLFALFTYVFLKTNLSNKTFLLSKNKMITVSFITGLVYETMLLSPWADIWTKGFQALIPIPLTLVVLALDNARSLFRALSFILLASLFLASLYDIRVILASIILVGLISTTIIIERMEMKRKILRNIIIGFATLISVLFMLRILPGLIVLLMKSSNPFGGIRTLTLPIIVGNYDFTSSFGLPFPYLEKFPILYISGIIFIAIILGLNLVIKFNVLTKTRLLLMLTLILLFSITYEHSPLKFVQKDLVRIVLYNIDLGVLFRTPRFFTSIEHVILSLLVGILIYLLFLKLSKARNSGMITFLAMFVILLVNIATMVSMNVYVNNNGEISPVWQKASIVPDYYMKIADIIKNNIENTSFRVLWLPRVGKYLGEKPPWLKSVCWGVGEKSIPLRTYFYYSNPMEYLYSFILKLALENKIKALSQILAYIGVKYVIINTDYWWKRMRSISYDIVSNLLRSSYFREIYNNGKLYVFENLVAKKAIRVSTTPILIEGGLETLANAIEKGLNITNSFIVFSDQIIPLTVLNDTKVIIVHNESNLEMDLLAQLVYWKKVNGTIIIPSRYTLGINPKLWHPYFITNPHHGEWEVFYTWSLKSKGRYDLDFREDWGFVGATMAGQKLSIPLRIHADNTYVIAIRYLENIKGGSFLIKLDNISLIKVESLNSDNAFRWITVKVYLSKGVHVLTLENIKGQNAINIIMVIPKSEFQKGMKIIKSILSKKTVINLSRKSHIVVKIHNDYSELKYTYKIIGTTYELNIIVRRTALKAQHSIYIVIPEQWFPSWIAYVENDKSFKVFSFPSLFIVAYEINLSEKNVADHTFSLNIKAFPEIDALWKKEFIILIVLSTIIVAISVVLIGIDKYRGINHGSEHWLREGVKAISKLYDLRSRSSSYLGT